MVSVGLLGARWPVSGGTTGALLASNAHPGLRHGGDEASDLGGVGAHDTFRDAIEGWLDDPNRAAAIDGDRIEGIRFDTFRIQTYAPE